MSSMPSTPVSNLSNSIGSPPSAGSGGPSTPLAPGVQQRLLLKQTAIDTWSLKEQLGLASAVLRSGDQNWVSVSRQMKPFSEDGRPSDWFSQKNCALQYNLLLNKVDTPRRKRGEKSSVESVETPGEAIVRKLTSERIKELRKVIEEETNQLMQLEDENRLLSDETIDDAKLKEIELQIEKEEREEAERHASHEKWLREREEKKQAIQAALKAHSSKLPLKGAAAAAVLQAGAARRASTQSERSSFSDFDGSPSAGNPGISIPVSLPVSSTDELKKEHHDLQTVDTTAASAPGGGEMSSVKSPLTNGQKGAGQDDTSEKVEVDVAAQEKIKPENEHMEIGETKEATKEDDSKIGTEALPEESGEEKAVEKIKEEDVEESAEVMPITLTEPEPEGANEEGEEEEEEDDDDDEDNEDDDEVIIKKEIDVEVGETTDTKKHTKVRPSRLKKGSEVSEDDSNDFNNSLETSKSKLSKRSKKNSERSDDNTDPTESQTSSQRATRHRSRKIDSGSNDNNGSTLASGETAVAAAAAETVENKRLSRVRDTEGAGAGVGVSRGRRGSGTTASRSSSPVGSGDESEVDQTPRGSRSRKKSGHKSTPSEAESAPASPSQEEALDVSTISSSAATEEWKKNALTVLTELRGHRWADKVMGVLQLSSKVYKRPIDLATIRKNVENGQLKNNMDLHHSLHHLFLNIIMSLNSESEVSSMLMII